MTRQGIVLRSSCTDRKMQPLLKETTENGSTMKMIKGETRDRAIVATTPATKKTQRFGEVVGGTAAECAAICCCCPCTVMNLVVLAVYRLPASLCKKAKKRQRLMRKKKLKEKRLLSQISGGSIQELEREVREYVEGGKHGDHHDGGDHDKESAAVDLEKEMWDRFYSAGFWRSPSQRGT